MSRFRLAGLDDETRLAIEEASKGTVTTEAARLLIEASVNKAQELTEAALQKTAQEVQSIIGPHGSVTQLQAGGINISRGQGVAVYASGVQVTTIYPDGTFAVGSNLNYPSLTTLICFVNDQLYNNEQMGAGDLLIGDNSTSSSNVKYDASEGQLQFRLGQTVNVYMDTDGTLKAGGGALTFDDDGMLVNQGGDAIVFRDTPAYGVISNTQPAGYGSRGIRLLSATVYPDSNLLTNGDFETGDFSNWTETDTDGTLSISALGDGYNGGYAAHYNTSPSSFITQNITASSYGLLLKFRLKVVSGNITPTANDVVLFSEFTTGGAWRNFYVIVPGSATSLKLAFPGGDCYVDDVVALPLTGAVPAAAYLDVGGNYINAYGYQFSVQDLNQNYVLLVRTVSSPEISLNRDIQDIDSFIYGTSATPVLKVDAGLNKAYYNNTEVSTMAFNDAEGDPANVGTTADGTSTYAARRDHVHGGGSSGLAAASIDGLTLSNNGTDATNDIDIAAGRCWDSTRAQGETLASALTKQLDAAWAVGTNQGGLDTGSIANTTYHVWLIKRSDTGVVDVLFSASATSPTMPANYDYKRRIGSIIRASNAIVLFSQAGNEFLIKTVTEDINTTNPGTSAVLHTLASIPAGIQVRMRGTISMADNAPTGNTFFLVTSPDQTDVAASASNFIFFTTTALGANSAFGEWRTNTSRQIRTRQDVSTANHRIRIHVHGWVDERLD